jgi:16S rRNA (cytosine967-C5)-methyltransferase
LVFGIQRLRGRLDYLLERKVKRGLESVKSGVRDSLRIGLYELLYMDGVPDYASVSQAVDLAQSKGGPGVSGFANAVLRGIKRDGGGPEHFPDPEIHLVEFLSTWGSHPRWLVERWLARWSSADVRKLVEANNSVPPLCLRCLSHTPEEAQEALEASQIDAGVVGSGTGCVVIGGHVSLEEAMTVVPAVVQDPAAALVVSYADPDPDAVVADLCAAPGGKTLALAARGNVVLAADRSVERLRLVRENLDRVRGQVGCLGPVSTVQADALAPPVSRPDMLLLDVPCTGTGTLRRNPDIRWKLTPGRLDEMAALQGRMLDACAEVVPSGGVLVYATCSLEPEENEEQIEAFMDRRPDFQMDPGAGVDGEFLDDRGYLYLTPQVHGFDGVFAARLRKV